MKIKIGNAIYSSIDQPIMVILTEADKENIANMAPEATRYAEFNSELGWTQEEVDQWMEETESNEHPHHRWLMPAG